MTSAADMYAQLREETLALEAEEDYRVEQQERERRHALQHSQPKPEEMSGEVTQLTNSVLLRSPGSKPSGGPDTVAAMVVSGGEGENRMAIDETTARYVASRQRKLLTDDDVVQVASNLPFIGENITPFLMGYHDDCLVEFLQGALNRPIESIRIHATGGNRTLMVRCTCPAYQPAASYEPEAKTPPENSSSTINHNNGLSAAATATATRRNSSSNNSSAAPQSDWVPLKIILVVLKAASLLVPSGTALSQSVYETMHLTCLNHEYRAVRGTSEEAVWRANRMSDQDVEIPLMLGFDACVHLIIVKNHADTAFEGYRTATEVLTNTRRPHASYSSSSSDAPAPPEGGSSSGLLKPTFMGFNGVTEVEKSCEYLVQFEAPRDFTTDSSSPINPWGHMQFQFISLPAFEDQVVRRLSSEDLIKKLKTSSYARWLWFFSRQNRVNFAAEVPTPVMDDPLIRSMWFAVATVALTDPILEGWSIEAEKAARAALVQPMVVEYNQRLDKFNADMARYVLRSSTVDE